MQREPANASLADRLNDGPLHRRDPNSALEMFVVYRRPRDFLQFEVLVREWHIERGNPNPVALPHAWAFMRIDDARALLEAAGLHRIPPQPGDDPVIVETWL